MIAVQRTGGHKEGHTAYIMCSPCFGTGWVSTRGRSSYTEAATCPWCYGTGVKDMLYETARLGHR